MYKVKGQVEGKFLSIVPGLLYFARTELEQKDRTAVIYTVSVTPFFNFSFMKRKRAS